MLPQVQYSQVDSGIAANSHKLLGLHATPTNSDPLRILIQLSVTYLRYIYLCPKGYPSSIGQGADLYINFMQVDV